MDTLETQISQLTQEIDVLTKEISELQVLPFSCCILSKGNGTEALFSGGCHSLRLYPLESDSNYPHK